MAGIYLHIPFCKQACTYCNFHFVTARTQQSNLVQALQQELVLRSAYLAGQSVSTIYFGGGTPSILSVAELTELLATLHKHYAVTDHAEVTLEANPDDIDPQNLLAWKAAGVNRLSIGIQSFRDEDLQWMHRAHTAAQGLVALQQAQAHFSNITIDLIYGIPGLSVAHWQANVEQALALGIPHLSCYALTVEPKTPLEKQIRTQQKQTTDPDQQAEHFLLLMDWLTQAGYRHYEISNFAKPGWESQHNQSYWQGAHYLGVGPSAHSFNGVSRQWNVANNTEYIAAIADQKIPFELETLTETQQLNEYIMTSLRTDQGMDLDRLGNHKEKIVAAIMPYFKAGKINIIQNRLCLTREGKLLADGIAAALFID